MLLFAKCSLDYFVKIYLRRINKKFEKNADRPRRPGHWRVVVRPVCVANARRGGKPGGYPNIKASPVIKCTKKGMCKNSVCCDF